MKLAVVGGTGADLLFGERENAAAAEETPFGRPSAAIRRVNVSGRDEPLGFLARHGADGSIPPHRVNYRANLWALKQFGPDLVVAINAVGGISPDAVPPRLCIPDQLIDYTWGREHTFSDGKLAPLQHVDFTLPYSAGARDRLLGACRALELDVLTSGTYGATQGPRLETSAEIDRLERDGCTIVGMTAMPEAGLARELGLPYACCAVIVNRAAGRGQPGHDIHAEIDSSLHAGMAAVGRLLASL